MQFRQRFAIWEVFPQCLSNFVFFSHLLLPTTFLKFELFESFPNDILFSLRVVFFTLFLSFSNFGHFLLLLAVTTMMKTTHSFEYSVTMSTESVYIEVFDFVLFFGSIDTFNCTFRSSTLEMTHHHILKASTSILKGFKFFNSASISHLVYKPVGIS